MRDRPPHPGKEPWWPATWIAFAFPLTGSAIGIVYGWPWYLGSVSGSLIVMLMTLWCHRRFKRWLVRARAWAAWLNAELEAGRVPPDIRMRKEM